VTIIKSGFLIAAALGAGAVCCWIVRAPGCVAAGWLLCAAAVFVLFFFRDPLRAVSLDGRHILSPADGRVMSCEPAEHEALGSCQVVRIFLSVFNVHLQRAPVGGVVESTLRQEGLYLPAYRQEAARKNARNTIVIQGDGMRLAVVQIVGVMARRIECWVQERAVVAQGQKIGFIRFGSQVDLFLPASVELRVSPGDRVRAGLDVIAIRNTPQG